MRDSNPSPIVKSQTSALLFCGIIAGPLYILVGMVQMLIREGFDPTRHALSLMSLGDLGWIQVSNFIVSGLLVIAAAVGIRQVLRGNRGGAWGAWGPLLLGVYGLSLIAAGVFVADPMDGFPIGTPPGPPEQVSWHGGLHFMAGGIGFLAVVAACFIFARYFSSQRKGGWAMYSLVTGVLFLAGFFSIASGGGAAWSIIAFTVAVVLIWLWLSTISAHLLQTSNSLAHGGQP